jgi:hypothetical protein
MVTRVLNRWLRPTPDAVAAPAATLPGIVPSACLPRERHLHARGRWRPGMPLRSGICRYEQLDSRTFRGWAAALGEPWHPHRKLWEYCFVVQALEERGFLARNRRGLGFAVGSEPLASFFASRGCSITATDLPADDVRIADWAPTSQWVGAVADLNRRGLCEPQRFARNVRFRPVDMNDIPDDLVDQDFTWSCCSFEHCGSIELGLRFLLAQMGCLRPGGVAVHTTELNLTSNDRTIDTGPTVIFRTTDLEWVIHELLARGHAVEPLDLAVGSTAEDRHIDRPPYTQRPHLRLELGGFVATSVGLIITKGQDLGQAAG